VELGGPQTVLAGNSAGWNSTLNAGALGRMLAGWRGAPALDGGALYAFCIDLATALERHEDVEFIECNPVILYERGHGLSVGDVMPSVSAVDTDGEASRGLPNQVENELPCAQHPHCLGRVNGLARAIERNSRRFAGTRERLEGRDAWPVGHAD